MKKNFLILVVLAIFFSSSIKEELNMLKENNLLKTMVSSSTGNQTEKTNDRLHENQENKEFFLSVEKLISGLKFKE